MVTRGRSGPFSLGVAATALVAITLSACGSSTGTPSKSASTSKSPYTVGVIADLTGAASTLGQPQMAGVKTWATAVNAKGGIHGHKVNLITCDASGSATGGANCAAKVSSAPIVVETSLIGSDKAALPSLTHNLVFATTPLLDPRRTTSPNVFQIGPTIAKTDAVALAAAQKNGIRSIGVIASDTATGTGAVKILTSQAPTFGVTITTTYVAANVTDATVQVSKLESDHVGMIFIATPGGAAAAVIGAVKSLGLTVPVIVTSAETTNAFLSSISSVRLSSMYGATTSGAAVVSTLSEPYRSQTKTFEQSYKKSTGKSVDHPILLGYYAGQLVGDVLGALGGSASLSSMETYVDSHSLPTMIGALSFDNAPSNVETGANPALLEVNSAGTAWTKCVSTSSFTC